MHTNPLFSMLEPGMKGREYYVKDKNRNIKIVTIALSDEKDLEGDDGLLVCGRVDDYRDLYYFSEMNLEVLALIPTYEELLNLFQKMKKLYKTVNTF